MLLSRLNHPYVVRYYTAWLEEDFAGVDDEAVSSTDGDQSDDNVEFGYSASGLDFISSSGYPKIEFGCDSDEDVENDNPVDEGWPCNKDTQSDTHERFQRTRSGSPSQQVVSTLYIQMEYCEKHVSCSSAIKFV
jgi:translation initiation factor 2-alpha kinase 4